MGFCEAIARSGSFWFYFVMEDAGLLTSLFEGFCGERSVLRCSEKGF